MPFLIFILTAILPDSAETQNLIARVFGYGEGPIENAHVINLQKETGDITNEEGYFKIPFNGGDSLLITCVGYRPLARVFKPDQLLDSVFIFRLKKDTVMLGEVLPWGTFGQFKKAVAGMRTRGEKQMEVAKQNMEIKASDLDPMNTPLDGKETARQNMNAEFRKRDGIVETFGISTTNRHLTKAVKNIFGGDKKKKKRKLKITETTDEDGETIFIVE